MSRVNTRIRSKILEEAGKDKVGIVGQQESANSTSAILLYRFPQRELWLPKSQITHVGDFSDAGFSWRVFMIPEWLYEEEAVSERNVYERRIENERPLTRGQIPIESFNMFTALDRSLWLRGQIRQLVSEYDQGWALDNGLMMGSGVQSFVDPTGEEGVATVKLHIPVEDEAETVIEAVRKAVDDDIGDVIGSEVRKKSDEIVWDARVRSPHLVR